MGNFYLSYLLSLKEDLRLMRYMGKSGFQVKLSFQPQEVAGSEPAGAYEELQGKRVQNPSYNAQGIWEWLLL